MQLFLKISIILVTTIISFSFKEKDVNDNKLQTDTIEKDLLCKKWALIETITPNFSKADLYSDSETFPIDVIKYFTDSVLQEVLMLNADNTYRIYWRNNDISAKSNTINKEEGIWSFDKESATVLFKCNNYPGPKITYCSTWFIVELKESRLKLEFQTRGGQISKTYIPKN